MSKQPTRQDYLDALRPLAKISLGLPEFNRIENSGSPRRPDEPYEDKTFRTVCVRAQFNRGGETGSLGEDDIVAARACVRNEQSVSVEDLRNALVSLAGLPVDGAVNPSQELYRFGPAVLTAGDILRARELIGDVQPPAAA